MNSYIIRFTALVCALISLVHGVADTVYAKPLLFTPNGGKQLIFPASSQNYIRTLDAVSGAVINTRQVQKPFLQSDIGYIPDTIGIIGTPIIDPATEIVYFYAKTYIPNYRAAGDTGIINGVYYFHAVHVVDLSDLDGFPILVDGSPADNDPRKYFIGGTILQRPSLLQVGSVIYAGFGGHCDLFNYTGTVLGVDVNQKKLVANWVVESGPNSRFSTDWLDNAAGGQGGIWQAGMGLASDGNRLFFATGNGASGGNQGTPASGQSGCRTLGEAVVNLGIDTSSGKLDLVDYFQPYDYVNMDGCDQDFGSGGVALLDPSHFNGTGVARIAITTGKNGKIYFMNADNLGGYKEGPGQTDGIIQTIVTNRAVFGGVESYPLEGGHVYSTPVGEPTPVYKLGFTSSGAPSFSLVGKTAEKSAGRVGPGVPVITTFKGRPGTAIMWSTDPDAGLRAWYAVPNPDQTMTRINLPQIGGVNKFQRPAFGDGRAYTTDANGVLYCLGAPVNLPMQCSSPVDFGDVALGSNKTQALNCTALIPITAVDGVTVGDLNFVVDSSTVPKAPIPKGATFTFNIKWDLTNVTVRPVVNASYGNTTSGVKSTALTLATTNGVGGHTTSFPLSLTGNEVSNAAFLSVTPQTVDFGGLVLGLSDEQPSSLPSFTIANLGKSAMEILAYAYTSGGEEEDDDDIDGIDYFNATYRQSDGAWDLGREFTAPYLPSVGGILLAGQQVSIRATFKAIADIGDYLSYFNVWSTDGHGQIILEGSASTKPIANFSISTSEGGWLPESNSPMDFGVAVPWQSVARQIRICNQGGSVLTITKSKPPLGDFRARHRPSRDPQPPNIPDFVQTNAWTLNVDDTSFGVHVVNMTGTVRGRQIGPRYVNGTARFNYLGCYLDNAAGARLLPNQPYVDVKNNTNEECQTACLAKGYVFAATEYHQECWCGNILPSSEWYYEESVGRCTFACPGDSSQACGGEGGYMSTYYDSAKYTIDGSTYNTSTGLDIGGPFTVDSTGGYDFVGCYSEGSNGRALSEKAVPSPAEGGSVEFCASQCGDDHFQYFGVEYANEYYCRNTIGVGSAEQPGDPVKAGCNMVCGGNASEYCGGPNRLNMFQLRGRSTATTTSSTQFQSITSIGAGTEAGIMTLSSPTTASTSSKPTLAPPTPTPPICPASNATVYTASTGFRFVIECDTDHQGGDLESVQVTGQNAFQSCIEHCATTPGCLDVSLSGVACYMKSVLGIAVSANGVLGAKLLPDTTSG
ncbi:WSC-domain-containing protein [Hortaea werneckii]|nr:WSC-domain-containing protein [Hortaea werneckii]